MDEYKFIHLLYVPTMNCNMECRYCYLEENTVDTQKDYGVLETLKYAIDKLKESHVIPFQISLHGGEVTTLPEEDFRNLIAYISAYYKENKEFLAEHGFRAGNPHIKTNLYQLDKHLDTIKEFNVSVSGSLDLPFCMHEAFRVTKGGGKTLERIFSNIALLEKIPNKKKVSATIFKEHFDRMEELIADIKYLHENTCLDMNDFNFMIGFAYNGGGMLTPLSEEEQVMLFWRMHEEFDGTDLDLGVNGAWFNEFGPEYCTNCDNCGEKFFLLERNGSVYSCVRGQKNEDYYYGNLYENPVENILQNAREKIFGNHNKLPFSEECAGCHYLYLCKTGCPFVKNVYRSDKSYTCRLQQELYKSRNYQEDEHVRETVYAYTKAMHPEVMERYIPEKENPVQADVQLRDLIASDRKLKYIYDSGVFILKVEEQEYKLESQILKSARDIIYITDKSRVSLYIKKHLLEEECPYPGNNAVYIMCLSGDEIVYGDEQRSKQAHLFSQIGRAHV